jgi:hypothetical protein
MKNQYFGDINDYRKYGLLRIIADGGSLKIGVCWMRTPDDGGNHGSQTQYLKQQPGIEVCDPQLFHKLNEIVNVRKSPCLAEAEKARLIPSAIYHADEVTELSNERAIWFHRMLDCFRNADLIFFDPDNGLEVESKPWRHKASPKHLYWHEVEETWRRGHSVLIYQHFPHIERKTYIKRRREELRKTTKAEYICSFRTSNVLFLLASQPKHVCKINQCIAERHKTWRGQIEFT